MSMEAPPTALRQRKRVVSEREGQEESDPWQRAQERFLMYRDYGNQDAFRDFYTIYAPDVHRLLQRMLRDEHEAEDLSQETFATAAQKCHLFDGSRNLRPWVLQIAHNKAIDVIRRRQRRVHSVQEADVQLEEVAEGEIGMSDLAESGMPEPSDIVQAAEESALVREAVLKLPPKFSATIELVCFGELSYEDAAEALGIATATARWRYFTALGKLKPLLRDTGFGTAA